MTACIIQRSYFLPILEKVGLHQVFSPQMIIANDIAGTIRSQELLTLHHYQNVEAEFVELVVENGSALVQTAVHQIPLPSQTLFVALIRGETVQIPRGDTVFQPADRVLVLCLKSNFNKVAELFNSSSTSKR